MTDVLVRHRAASTVGAVDGRTVTVQLCRWNEPRTVTDPGTPPYLEQFAPGSLQLAERAQVTDKHHGDLIGTIVPGSLRDGPDGPTVDLRIVDSVIGDHHLALIREQAVTDVSMEFSPVAHDLDAAGTVTRTAVVVRGVAFAFTPAHTAPILAVRETETTTMPTETDARPGPLPDAPAEEPKPKPKPAPKAVTVDVLERSITDLRDDMTRAMLEQRPAPAAGHPAVVHRSFADYADAVWHDASDPVLRRVLADQITTNNPGVIPPAWLSSVFGILDFGRPTITAFGVSGLPASGMELTWPYFDGDVMTLVGEQVVQKTAVTSVRVDLKKGSEAIRTFAGGSDISYQLIRRSDPSYRDAYLRIMMIAYAAVTNAAAAADAVAAATASAATWDPAAGTADALAEALFTASVEVESATGMPATFALAASDVFIAAGTAAVVNAANYGVQNVPGTASASTLAVSFAGLTLVHDGSLPAGTLLVSNGATAEWYEDGPFTVTAEDVEKLGQNVAVWGMGAFAVPLPAGIVSIGDGIP